MAEFEGYKKWKGWVIARKLFDPSTNKKSYFTYYPREFDGKPTYFFKTKSMALKEWNKLKEQNKFPANQSNVKLVKYKPSMYLNRY